MAAIKHSRQRDSIQKFLMSRKDHPTADVVYENVKMVHPNISLGTVYRNLNLLAEMGEIRKLSNFDGADHFDGRIDEHYHFQCSRCQKIYDMDDPNIDSVLKEAGINFSGKITGFAGQFTGICEHCLEESKAV